MAIFVMIILYFISRRLLLVEILIKKMFDMCDLY